MCVLRQRLNVTCKNKTKNEFNSIDDCLDHKLKLPHTSIRSRLSTNTNNKRRRLNDDNDLAPITFGEILKDNRYTSTTYNNLKILIDSGASGSMIHSRYLNKNKLKQNAKQTTVWTTMSGEFRTLATAKLNFTLPELSPTAKFTTKFYVTTQKSNYDIILGRDTLRQLGIKIDFQNNTIGYGDGEIDMKPISCTRNTHYNINESGATKVETERLKRILDAKYEKANLQKVVGDCNHLKKIEQTSLLHLLQKYEDLFDGTLGQWTDLEYGIELREGAKPYHAKPYGVPKAYEDTFRTEVERLCKVGVLRKVNHSEWAAPTFLIPKKDKTVRFISDFRELNKRIKRKPFPIPKIQDLLLKLEGFKYATSLDLNMGYYHIQLEPASRKLCTIVLPWGKYEYVKLPMGLCNSPDIFQEKMSELFYGFENVRAYIDDLLVINNSSFDDHLKKLDKVLCKLQSAGLKVNPTKSFFAKSELEYLGYWITQSGVTPVP